MIIWMEQPFANDHQDESPSCNWSSGGTRLLQMIIQINDLPFPAPLFSCSANKIFFFTKYFPSFPLLMIFSSTKSIIFVSIYVYFWLPYLVFFASEKIYFPSQNIMFPSNLRFIPPQQKRIPSLNFLLLFLLCSHSHPKAQNQIRWFSKKCLRGEY